MVTSAKIPSVHISGHGCRHGSKAGNAAGGLWCPVQAVR